MKVFDVVDRGHGVPASFGSASGVICVTYKKVVLNYFCISAYTTEYRSTMHHPYL